MKRAKLDKSNEFSGSVRAALDKLSPRLKRVLKKLIAYKFDPAVRLLFFEVFSDGFTEGFPVRLFFYDANWNEYFIQVKGKWEYPCDVDPDLLHIKRVYAEALEEEFENDVDDPWSIAVDALVKWFAECWQEVGGDRCKLPAYISQYDSGKYFDLRKQKWGKQASIDLST